MHQDAKLEAVARAICAAHGLTFQAEVGSGAFKRTFEVRRPDGTSRALKVYRKSGMDGRTAREVDAISRCTHPGIVQFERLATLVHEGDEFVFSLEEFLSGGTLTMRIGFRPFTIDEIRDLAPPLIEAVGHIASLGLVHRDLKPDNVMFRDAMGKPVIVDFGLVRDLRQASLTKTWQMQGPGTPFFAPPEQLNNEKQMIDWRADQFSLGVLLTMASAGYHPYGSRSSNPDEIVERVSNRDGPSVDFVSWADANGLHALRRMVAPWPVSRFRTASLLSDAWRLERTGDHA